MRVKADSIRLIEFIRQAQHVKDSIIIESLRLADSARESQELKRKELISNFQLVLQEHPYFNFYGQPRQQSFFIRNNENNEGIFYFIIGLVLYLALMRMFFNKYISTMFTLFFRATLRQQQLREQMLQAPLPALLMNIFFIVSLAAYCSFIAGHLHIGFYENFWTTFLYAVIVVAGIYIVKFIFLNIVGWIFGISNVTDTYIFIVFLINKMIGIFLLPFIALLAFPTPSMLPAVLILSYILVGGMLFYRFLISYRPVRSEIKLNRFHFFLYLCAFEIAPLLLIYKVLLAFVDSSL